MSDLNRQVEKAIREAERALEVNDNPPPNNKVEVKKWNPVPYENDPVKFAIDVLHFTPTEYQTQLLIDANKRIVVIWPRQSGKTTTLSIRMIWYAAEHPRTVSLIVAPAA